ncbi:hypothetical protein SAMN04487829_0499 [Pseudobutyrivibrio sp. NOR37]|uniref:Uncharacterized protein n=1 Tax=Pseudobutyrivibrio xylanivorans TaxID=185007 RepID=A0A6M0LE72_PSEXY|nr:MULTISPECIES: hypothetical protein [Pseudobutyrivibrio]MBR5952671.1 hypothetical protein [Pseudobutyrivibrio sp.]NEX00918.1 hypothetical protein [Pseudobutyrivibrio xylanivorans]SFR63688.1 hypothetical protein SAMN04487829_0499 [Pseudobutyrivibrio sp. NOR37]
MSQERPRKSPLSKELYSTLVEDGYSIEFATLITDNLNTDFTAGRMLGYLAHYDHLPEVEIADEMLAILSDRKQIMDKKAAESYNAAWNNYRQAGIFDDIDE